MSDKMFDLSGKTAIVTGASRGLGQYFGRALANAGADLVITGRSLETLDVFQKEIESMGRKALPLQLDAGGRRYYYRIDPSAPRTKRMKGREHDKPQTPYNSFA